MKDFEYVFNGVIKKKKHHVVIQFRRWHVNNLSEFVAFAFIFSVREHD